LIVQVAQCQHRRSHQKLERDASWQPESGTNSQSHAGIPLLLPAPLNNCHYRDASTIFNPTPSIAVGGQAELPRAEYGKPKTQGNFLPVWSPTSGVASISNETSMATSSTRGMNPTPQANVPGSPASGKKGLAYNSASLTHLFAGKGIGWAYNWAATPDGSILAGAEYVAMLWGRKSIDSWQGSVNASIASGTTSILSFNEPDHPEQANMDPAVAAQIHIDQMNPLADQVSIGSPAITNGPMGIQWLQNFFDACGKRCKVDFVAFHWYDSARNFAYFKRHVEDVILFANRQDIQRVWLTEFGASGSDDEVATFLRQAVDFLDANPAVERYAYFMCSDGILVNGDVISIPIGEEYIR
jgi:hypothetical protein